MADAPRYVGRFAPSPTGPLHFGSLVAAVASYLQAKNVGAAPGGGEAPGVGAVLRTAMTGEWHIRIEDLDPPREAPGAVASILSTLDRFGFEWDGEVTYQSRNGDRFEAALAQLQRQRDAYPCACSRKEIADSGIVGIEGPVYPGTCRNGIPDGKEGRAWRVRTAHTPVAFVDRVFGHVEQDLEALTGDFVVRRADGYWAYQLAVVVDDAAQGITEVVRGADLLDSTTRQVHLQRLLGLPTPAYMHVPVAAGADGRKLSKTTGAVPLDAGHEGSALWHALHFLGQRPPEALRVDALDAVWSWAREHWDPARVPAVRVAPAPV